MAGTSGAPGLHANVDGRLDLGGSDPLGGKRMRTSLLLLLVVLAMAGCSSEPSNAPQTLATSAGIANGSFAPYSAGATAITYDAALVPAGARATVMITTTTRDTETQLTVKGLRPNRAYGAHLHTNPCGAEASTAGPHYQHQIDPSASASAPSENPSYANPRNEVWLDFTTDAHGDARSVATQQWTFDARKPRSLVIHAEATSTTAGHASARVACLTLPG
jgi:Cu-Zn family superoxide dismutase